MNSQSAQACAGDLVVGPGERAGGGEAEEARGRAASVDPGVLARRTVAETERLVEEGPQEHPAEAEPDRGGHDVCDAWCGPSGGRCLERPLCFSVMMDGAHGVLLGGFLGWFFPSSVGRPAPGQQCLRSPRGRDLCPCRRSSAPPRLRAAEGEHRNMTEPDKIRVFLLDDHEVVRAGPARPARERRRHRGGRRVRLGRGGDRTGSPRCARTSRCSTPGCPTAPGSTCAATSARSTRRIQALILTSYDDDEALFAAIMAGASGYVLKQIRGTDLIDAVRQVAAGSP